MLYNTVYKSVFHTFISILLAKNVIVIPHMVIILHPPPKNKPRQYKCIMKMLKLLKVSPI